MSETLQSMLRGFYPLPKHVFCLGQCHDSLPLLVSLTDSAPGSILSVADSKAISSGVVYNALASAMMINSMREVACHLFSEENTLNSLKIFPHLFTRTSSVNGLEQALEELHEEIYIRNRGRRRWPAILLGVDDIGNIFGQLEGQYSDYLLEAADIGPELNIRVIASAVSRSLKQEAIATAFKSVFFFKNEERYFSRIGDDTLAFNPLPLA